MNIYNIYDGKTFGAIGGGRLEIDQCQPDVKNIDIKLESEFYNGDS